MGFVADIFGGGNDAPPAPDYTGAANATAAGNLEAARATAAANRVNQYTPYGSLVYSQTPTGNIDYSAYNKALSSYNTELANYNRSLSGETSSGAFGLPRFLNGFLGAQGVTGSTSPGIKPIAPRPEDFRSYSPDSGWSYTQTLSPSGQELFDQNTRINKQLGNVAEQGVGYVQSALDKPLSLNGMYSVGTPGEIQTQASDAAYKNATRYLDPMMARNQAALDVKLANQGITRGSEAYENAISDFNQNRDQQYDAARNQAYIQGLQGAGQQFNQGTNLRQNQITEAQLLQNNPINMLNAVRTGAQMQTAQLPQQLPVAQQQGVAGPDLLGAATATGNYNQGVYNAGQASKSGMLGGLFNLGAGALMAPAGTFTF